MLFWCTSLLLLFIALPTFLLILGFSRSVTLSFVIGVIALFTDGLLTKIGLKHDCFETNPIFRLLKGKIKENYMIVLSRLAGISLLFCVLFLFNDEFLLLVFDLALMVCVIANSITLFLSIISRFFLIDDNISDSDID